MVGRETSTTFAPEEQRRAVIAELRQLGVSVRDIGLALGYSRGSTRSIEQFVKGNCRCNDADERLAALRKSFPKLRGSAASN